MKKDVRRAKEQLENMIEVLNDILEGKLTQAQAAAKFGISPQNFGRYTTSSFVFAPTLFSALICAGALSAPTLWFWGRFLPPFSCFDGAFCPHTNETALPHP